MRKNLILVLSALLIVSAVFWQKGSDLVTQSIDRHRMTVPPVDPIVHVSGTDTRADAAALINAAERLYEQKQSAPEGTEGKGTDTRPDPSTQPVELVRVKALAADKEKAQQMLDQSIKRLVKELNPKARQTYDPVASQIFSLASTQAEIGDWAGSQESLLAMKMFEDPGKKRELANRQFALILAHRTPEEAISFLPKMWAGDRVDAARRILQKYPGFLPAEQVVSTDLNPSTSQSPIVGAKLSESERNERIRRARLTLLQAALSRGDFAAARAQLNDLPDLASLTAILGTVLTMLPSPEREQFRDMVAAKLERIFLDAGTPRWKNGGQDDHLYALRLVAAVYTLKGQQTEAQRLLQTALDHSYAGSDREIRDVSQWSNYLTFLHILQQLPKEEIAKMDFSTVIDNAWDAANRLTINNRVRDYRVAHWDLAVAASELHEPEKARELTRRARWELTQWDQKNLYENGKPYVTGGWNSTASVWSQMAQAQARQGDTKEAVLTLSRIRDRELCARAMILVASVLLEKPKKTQTVAGRASAP